MKKIQKKKKLLRSQQQRKISTEIVQHSVQVLSINHKEQFNIRGKFQFVIINGYLEMDLYEVKNPQIYSFESKEYVSVTGHGVPCRIEEYLTKFQSQEQSEVYLEFLNYILKNKPNQLTLLIYGQYETTTLAYIMSEQKSDFLQNQFKSVMFLGEKQVGKSTSLHLYANYLMNKNQVFILDTDLGQSIILPGFVTLLKIDQPLFLKEPTILFQGFVGEYQVFNHLDLYFNKISQALDVYNQSQLLKDYPLLINTAGFITNYGITIIQELLNILQPQQCLILSRDNQKKIQEKSNNLYEELTKKSFISNFQTFKTQVQLIHESFDFEECGQNIQQQTPQQRKQNRMIKIANNIGTKDLNYLTLCEANYKTLNTNKCQFVVINEKRNYFDLEEIAQVFIFSLVAIEQDGLFQGLGLIRDLDMIHNNIHIISRVQFEDLEYCIIKSKHFEIPSDILGELQIEELYQFLDQQCIQNGEPLEYLAELPYLSLRSEAIGDFKHKVTVNKKVF